MGKPSPYYEMKRVLGVIPSTASGRKDASALIYTGATLLTGVKVVTNGTDNVTVVVYDNTEGSGKVVDEWTVTGSENYGGTNYGKSPVIIDNGIYVTVSGTGGKYYVFYFTPTYELAL